MTWMPRCSHFLSLLLALALSLAATSPARALDVGFDDLVSGSDVAVAVLPGVSVSSAVVLSESDAQALGYPAVGTFATSGSQGLLNTLAPTIRFTFTTAVTSFSIDILSLENDGVTLPITLRGLSGANESGESTSDPSLIGDSGYHEQRLSLAGLFTSVELAALGSDKTSTFWLDSASFTPVPEPGTLSLLGAGLAALAGLARGRGDRA